MYCLLLVVYVQPFVIVEGCRCCILKGGLQALRANSPANGEGLRYMGRYLISRLVLL